MLVLSRLRDEQIVIGDDVTVTVVELRGDKVWLGIDAPPTMPVHRREVYDAIQRKGGVSDKPLPIDWQYKCGQLAAELAELRKENAELKAKLEAAA